ncbi:hypothetical protein BWI17_00435 [Betaproteobacteria bacterium GR16-43]|nr:hypothetical protein BWI17_00435 [Betaproteobacteria bacterium GR16-43]
MRDFRFDLAFAPLVLSLAFLAPAGAQEKIAAPLKTIPVKVGAHALKVEVADNDATRSRGLMFRDKMGENDGMLFIFPDLGYHSMWMMNTKIPLSVAFIGQDGKVLNVLDMEPNTQDTHSAAGPARYAIETNKGWFAKKKIKPGDQVTGLPKAGS